MDLEEAAGLHALMAQARMTDARVAKAGTTEAGMAGTCTGRMPAAAG
jgi:hypothetical protein